MKPSAGGIMRPESDAEDSPVTEVEETSVIEGGFLRRRWPIFVICVVAILIGTSYVGIGYMIASQALAAQPGCGIFADNTPDDWSVTEDWNSSYFQESENAERRVSIRRDFNLTGYMMEEYENVTFKPRGGEDINLVGWYVEADPEAPVIVMVHGIGLNGKCKNEMILAQAMLTRQGLNTLNMDMRNYGFSGSDGEYIGAGWKEYRDVLGAYDWLISEKGYEAGSIGLFGVSGGGGTAIALMEEAGLGALWLDSAWLDWPLVVGNELERLGFPRLLSGPALRVGGKMADVDFNENHPMDLAHQLNGRPVYLQHADGDTRVSVQHAYNFKTAADTHQANVTHWNVEGYNHVDVMWAFPVEYESKMGEFFHNALSSSE